MDLSKAFDCLPHDLLIAKHEAYGFDTKTLNIFKSYLNQRKQFVNINGTLSDILEILSGVPQGSILGPILFNIFINDLLVHIKSTNTHNYADDNTLSAYGDTVIEVTKSLEKGAEEALSWFLSNGMSANADKFQAIFCRKDKKSTAGISLKIGSEEIESEDQVKLVGVRIENKLSFNEYISSCLKQASAKMNSIK